MGKIPFLPVNPRLGFPQRVRCVVGGEVYEFRLRFNEFDAPPALIVQVRRRDGTLLFNGKVPTGWGCEVRDPQTGEELFTIFLYGNARDVENSVPGVLKGEEDELKLAVFRRG